MAISILIEASITNFSVNIVRLIYAAVNHVIIEG